MTSQGLRLALATTNAHKVSELAELLSSRWPETSVLPRPSGMPEVIEDAPDLRGNAVKKAVAVRDFSAIPALADDSGLMVDALGGAPGVRSARFAGVSATDEQNLRKLLADLQTTPAAGRSARFECVIALVDTVGGIAGDDGLLVATGTVEGTIAPEPRGTGGFGYDPVFVPDEGDGRTFAEMTSDEKNQISHRGRALADLMRQLG